MVLFLLITAHPNFAKDRQLSKIFHQNGYNVGPGAEIILVGRIFPKIYVYRYKFTNNSNNHGQDCLVFFIKNVYSGQYDIDRFSEVPKIFVKRNKIYIRLTKKIYNIELIDHQPPKMIELKNDFIPLEFRYGPDHQ